MLPVVITMNCYAMDALSGIGMTNAKSDSNKAAARYGFARFGLSSAWSKPNNPTKGFWGFPGIVNDDHPMPCSDADSRDIPYLRVIFDFIAANPDKFDQRIYIEGFSQNSVFAAYAGFCFHDRVTGIWHGASGLVRKDSLPYGVSCQARTTGEGREKCTSKKCAICEKEQPCKECQYWPIWPCYTQKRPMIDCLTDYTNDGVTNDVEGDPIKNSGAQHMYDALVQEGHDARLFRFAPVEDGSIKTKHSATKNIVHWQVGCWGITPPCTETCQTEFLKCVNGKNPTNVGEHVKAFASCINEDTFTALEDCTSTCAPTLEMLKASEMPAIQKGNNFGASNVDSTTHTRPDSSLCNADEVISL